MCELGASPSSESVIEMLPQVWVIGLATGSAILTICYPEEFAVLDYRA